MKFTKKYQVALLLALVVIIAGTLFFYRMYQNDVAALAEFSTSYATYDKAVAEFFISKTPDMEKKADTAFVDLKAKATFRLSSLIKNDRVIPAAALAVAELSGQELDSLKSAWPATDVTSQRKAAYIHFLELVK